LIQLCSQLSWAPSLPPAKSGPAPTYADNVALPAFARRCCITRAISPAHSCYLFTVLKSSSVFAVVNCNGFTAPCYASAQGRSRTSFILLRLPNALQLVLDWPCIRGTSHGPVSVRRVRPSQVGVLLKRMNDSSWVLAFELPSTRPTLC